MKKMKYDLAYGKGHLSVDIDTVGNTQEILPKTAVAQPELERAVLAVMEQPIEADSPVRSLSDSSTLAIVIDEPSTACPTAILLGSVLSGLRVLGTKPANVSILVAHQPASAHAKEDMNKLLGDPVSDGYALVIHDPNNREALSNIGGTSTSHTPLEINTTFLQADYRIGISAIRPDPFAGATGGGTSVLPGVSGLRTILRSMRLRALTSNGPLDMECPACLDASEASCLAGLDFIVNVVPDWKGSIACVVGGDPSAAWFAGVEVSRALSSATITRLADVVVVSAGGFPFDRTLYDAVDCLHAAVQSTRRDGVIVLVAECVDGLGPDGFAKGVLENRSEKEVIQTAKKRFEIGMEKSRLFRHVTDSRSLIICSKLQELLVEEELMCRAARDPEEALQNARRHLGSWSNTIVLPRGGDTIIEGI